jgi:hypothetical protein
MTTTALAIYRVESLLIGDELHEFSTREFV